MIPAAENTANIIALTATTLAPAGIEKANETKRPIKKHTTEITAETTTTFLKVLHTLIAVSAGKIIRLEISMAPIILIPITIVIAVRNAIKALSLSVFTPAALAKLSSSVTAKSLL